MKDQTKQIVGAGKTKVVRWKFELPTNIIGEYQYTGITGTIDEAREYAIQLFKMYKERLRSNIDSNDGYNSSTIGFWINDYEDDYLNRQLEIGFRYELLANKNESNAWKISFC